MCPCYTCITKGRSMPFLPETRYTVTTVSRGEIMRGKNYNDGSRRLPGGSPLGVVLIVLALAVALTFILLLYLPLTDETNKAGVMGSGDTREWNNIVSIEYSEKSMANGLFSCTGAVIFAGLDGAYVMKKKKSKAFWSVHEADTNAIYAQHFPFYYFPAEDGSRLEHRHDTINEDEYLVLRTRVKTDPSGKIKSANYSKIYGPILVGRGFRFRESCFNPTRNDPNIEFDVKRNLFKKPHGTLLP